MPTVDLKVRCNDSRDLLGAHPGSIPLGARGDGETRLVKRRAACDEEVLEIQPAQALPARGLGGRLPFGFIAGMVTSVDDFVTLPEMA